MRPWNAANVTSPEDAAPFVSRYAESMVGRGLWLVLIGVGCASSSEARAVPDDAALDDAPLADSLPDGVTSIPEPRVCRTSADCSGGEVCGFRVGDCKAQGLCMARAGGEGTVAHCGCDGRAILTSGELPPGFAAVPTRGQGICPRGVSSSGPVCERLPAAGCPTTPCPAGSLCAVEIGGVKGGGGSGCVPIPTACSTTPTCACMGLCACGESFGRAELCTDVPTGGFRCDDGVR